MENKQTPLTDENDLERKSRRDNYYIGRVLKYIILACVSAIIVVLTIGFIIRFYTNASFQSAIMDIIKTYFASILLAGLSIIGINVYARNSK